MIGCEYFFQNDCDICVMLFDYSLKKIKQERQDDVL